MGATISRTGVDVPGAGCPTTPLDDPLDVPLDVPRGASVGATIPERLAAPVGRPEDGLVAPGVPGVNQVLLVGRVSTPAQEHELPNGDLLVTLRLVVPRPASRTLGDRRRPRVPVDTIDIACWTAATRRRAVRFEGGELLEVTGALRRRFDRAGTVALSRYEVEARSLRRVRETTLDDEAVGG